MSLSLAAAPALGVVAAPTTRAASARCSAAAPVASRSANLAARKAGALAGAAPTPAIVRRSAGVASASRSPLLVQNIAGLFGDKKKTVIITGASSGLGKATVDALANLGEYGSWHIVMAVRDVEKAREVADELELKKGSYTILECEMGSLKSVSDFCNKFKSTGKRLDALVCNAAVYLPNQQAATYTDDGFEESFQVNHLSHHLMIKKLLPELKKTKGRCIIVGSITGNTNTVGGGAVLPLADLGDLRGLKAQTEGRSTAMLDGGAFNGAKAYKDSKLCNMMTMLELHRRYHESTGIVFASMYPGCIAETALFRQKRTWFRKFFPIFMKYVTGAYVSEKEAGERLSQVIGDDITGEESGVYWSWNGGARTVGIYDPTKKQVVGAGGAGGEIFRNKPSREVRDPVKAKLVFDLCDEIVAKYDKASGPALSLLGAK